MAEPFIGEIQLFPYNFAPLGWAYCTGQKISAQQYPALYALIGNAWGGTPGANFNLPNLAGQVVVGVGQGAGLTNRTRAQTFGRASVVLEAANQPQHNHPMYTTGMLSTAQNSPTVSAGCWLGWANQAAATMFTDQTKPQTAFSPAMLGQSGNVSPVAHENRQPVLAVPYCIALTGWFPPQP